MRALRGDLFEITDENPLALSDDEDDPSGSPAGGDVEHASNDEARPEPEGPPKPRKYVSPRRVLYLAVVAAAAAAGFLALEAPEPRTQPGPGSAAPTARTRVRPDDTRPVRSTPPERRERAAAPRRRRAPTPPIHADTTPTAAASPIAAPPAPIAIAPAPLDGLESAQREFGFER